MNGVLVHATNSIPGERMRQVMDAKTTSELALRNEPELVEYAERTADNNVRKQKVRLNTSLKRAATRGAHVGVFSGRPSIKTKCICLLELTLLQSSYNAR